MSIRASRHALGRGVLIGAVASLMLGLMPPWAAQGDPVPGSLDMTFDGDGMVTTSVLSTVDHGQAVAIQPDGKIVVAGGASDSGWDSNNRFAVVRYDTDGSLDTGFDLDGKVTTAVGSHDQATAVAIQPDGKIVVAGRVCVLAGCGYAGTPGYDVGLVRYLADGTLDSSFGGDGTITTDFEGGYDQALDIAIQPDGKIVVAGAAYSTTGAARFAVARYTQDGSLDTGFDGDGKATTDIGAGGDAASALAIQSDGRIVAVGHACAASEYPYCDVAAARYDTDGSLDTGFGVGGVVVTPLAGEFDTVNDVALDPDGKIVAAGFARIGAYWDSVIVRYDTNGNLDASFDGDGIVVTSVSSDDDVFDAVAVQTDGKIVAGDNARTGTWVNATVVRYATDGSLDTTFDGDGIAMTSAGVGDSSITALAIQPDGKIVGVGAFGQGSAFDILVVRFNGDPVAIDTTPPTLAPTVSPNPVVLGGSAAATANATDVSGIATESCDPVDTSVIGTHTVECTATDIHGNSATASATYQVIYAFGGPMDEGFLTPVDDQPVVNAANAGSAIPVKFSLSGDQGTAILASGYPTSIGLACEAGADVDGIEQTVAAGGSSLSYDPVVDVYTYVWKTDRMWAGTCRQLVIKLADGTVHRADFRFKKK